MRQIFILVCILLSSTSCMIVNGGVELTKTFWGSTTRVLEQGRTTAIAKTYGKAYWDCIRSSLDVFTELGYTVFKKDEIKGYIILMGVHGAVNTTEIGVFFVEVNDNETRIEISSLSTNAKRIVAKDYFHALDIAFGLVPPDPLDVKPVEDPGNKK